LVATRRAHEDVNENGSSAVAPDAADVLDTPQAGSLALRGSAYAQPATAAGCCSHSLPLPLLIRHLHQVGFGRYTTALSIADNCCHHHRRRRQHDCAARVHRKGGGAPKRRDGEPARSSLLFSALGVLAALTFATLAGYSSTLVLGTVVASVG